MERKTRKTLSVSRPSQQPAKSIDARREWIEKFGSTRVKETVERHYSELRVYRKERVNQALDELGALSWFGRSMALKKGKPSKKSSPSQAALNFLGGLLSALDQCETLARNEDDSPPKLTIVHIEPVSDLAELFSPLGARADQPDACFDPLLDEECWQAGEALLVENLFDEAEPIILPIPKVFPNVADPRS